MGDQVTSQPVLLHHRLHDARRDGGTAATRPFTLDSVFTGAARRCPAAVAVREEAGRLTYARANARSTQLASALVLGGLQLGDPVVVHCDDHRQSVVGQLAVLRAGGVCVPVRSDLAPAEVARTALVSGARVVLCSTSTRSSWPDPGLLITLDEPGTWERLAEVRIDPALPRSGPMDAAYLLVDEDGGQLVDHRAWQYVLAARMQQIGPARGPVAVRQAPGGPRTLSAMWWAFASGGALCGRAGDAAAVQALGGAAGSVFSPEEYARLLTAAADRPVGAGPGAVVLFGGPCPPELVERHFAAYRASRLRGEFAPDGSVTPWTAQELSPGGPVGATASGVGTPVPNVHIQVTEPGGRVLPSGRVGELCATGPALPFDRIGLPEAGLEAEDFTESGRGYLHRSPWLARWRADGTLELVGARPARA
ncbi:AMP-binding protein [Kitasatospora sp. NPDC098652]|uniref:AMP-binding protein n=1 Tax=Kitasatospora sp. NPDC098652 TaxID=3364095 RepID=UPI00380083EE